MNADIYAEYLSRQGRRVIRTASSFWQSDSWGVFQAFPYHWAIQPPPEELRELLLHHHATALRYSAPAGHATETNGYHAVFTGADYDFDVLSGWARKNVRRGLRACKVGPISFQRYAEEGWRLRCDTLARQGRRLGENREDWNRKCLAAADLDGFNIWAAEVNGHLAATLLMFQMDDWGYMVYQQCHSDYLRDHANNALSFVVTQHFIRDLQVKGVFYGVSSLDAPPSVDEFKFRMGYEARPVWQTIEFHPYLGPLVNTVTHWASEKLLTTFPQSYSIAKAEGMLRVCLAERNPQTAKGLSCSPLS